MSHAIVKYVCQGCTRRIGPGYEADDVWLLPLAPAGKRRVCRFCAQWARPEEHATLLVRPAELAALSGLALLRLIKEREGDIIAQFS